MKKITLLYLFFSFCSYAQVYEANDTFSKRKLISRDKNIVKVKPSTDDDSIILHEKNPDSGVYETTYDTQSDEYKYSINFYVNHNPLEITDYIAGEFVRSSRQTLGWNVFYFSVASTTFDTIGASGYIDPYTKETILSVGAGYEYRFKLIQTVFDTTRLFETVSAFATFNALNEDYNGALYLGPGVKTDYGIHYRKSSSIHYGIRFSYSLATLKGSPKEGDLDLTINWLSMAFELGMNY